MGTRYEIQDTRLLSFPKAIVIFIAKSSIIINPVLTMVGIGFF